MNHKDEHRQYLGKKHFDSESKSLLFDIEFSAEETKILRHFGYWMLALEKGKINPITKAQKLFVGVSKGKLKPETVFEKVWMKFKSRYKLYVNNKDPDGLYSIKIEPKFTTTVKEILSRHHIFTNENDFDEYDDDFHLPSAEEIETQQIMDEINEERSSYVEGYARSKDDGWYYDDKEHWSD